MTTSNNIVYGATTPWGVGVTPSATDRTVNPGLINPAGGNFSLSTGAAAIGAGLNLSSIFVVDNHMAPSPQGSLTKPVVRGASWDVGAYAVSAGGTAPTPTPTPTATPSDLACLAADINQDGTVNSSDRTMLLGEFLHAPPSNPRTDVSGDGVVDLMDYSRLVRYFGQRCE